MTTTALTPDERAVLNAAATGTRVCMAIVGPDDAQRIAKAVGELSRRGLIWDQQVALGVYYWRATAKGVEEWERAIQREATMITVCAHCERQIAGDEAPDDKTSVGICEPCEAEYVEAHPVDKG